MGRSTRKRSMVTKEIYSQGDVVYVDCDPQAGHEQKGRRPALVVSNNTFNRVCGGMIFVCPITNTQNSHPLHVPFPEGCKVTGAVLVDHIRSIDASARNATFYDKAPDSVLDQVVEVIKEVID